MALVEGERESENWEQRKFNPFCFGFTIQTGPGCKGRRAWAKSSDQPDWDVDCFGGHWGGSPRRWGERRFFMGSRLSGRRQKKSFPKNRELFPTSPKGQVARLFKEGGARCSAEKKGSDLNTPKTGRGRPVAENKKLPSRAARKGPHDPDGKKHFLTRWLV